MALTKSLANNIRVFDGNSLAVFIDATNGELSLRDIYGNKQALSSIISAGVYERSTGTCSIVPIGQNNTASGDYASILGGNSNSSSGLHSSITNGVCNTIIGGTNPEVSETYTVASGQITGFDGVAPNSIDLQPNLPNFSSFATPDVTNTFRITFDVPNPPFQNPFVVSGVNNFESIYVVQGDFGLGEQGVIYFPNGLQPVIDGDATMSDIVSVEVIQPENNFGSCSFIGGGEFNTICSNYSTIGGGQCNEVNGVHSFIGAGHVNIIDSSKCSAILSGQNNCMVGGVLSSIIGGFENTLCSNNSFIGSGDCNLICATSNVYNTIINGCGNCLLEGSYNVIVNGSDNSIRDGGNGNFIGNSYYRCNPNNGSNNIINSSGSTILNGYFNIISFVCENGSILGGSSNTLEGANNSTIVGGSTNFICSSVSVIGGGQTNKICGSVSVIGGGQTNTIGQSSIYSSILGGTDNDTCNFQNVHIIGSNLCATASNYTFVNNLCNVGGGTSDCRLKENIKPLSYGLSQLTQLEPVEYNFIDDESKKTKYGFLAQCVQEIMPELIYYHPTETVDGEKVLQFDKDAVFVSMINAIKELRDEIEALKK